MVASASSANTQCPSGAWRCCNACAARAIDPARLVAAHAALAARHAVLIAEGAGGWRTPLGPGLLLGDWVAAQGWPVLLVVRLNLGALNHALLTAEAIASRGVRLAGWVANAAPPDSAQEQGMIDTLAARLGPPLWVQRLEPLAPAAAVRQLLAGLAPGLDAPRAVH